MSALRQATSSRGEFKRASMCSSLTRFATGRSRRLAIASAAEWSSSWPEPGAQLAGAISVHGSLESAQRARAGDVTAKVLVCHGALDPHVPTTQLTAFIEEMNAAGTDYQLIVYGGAMHGFTHDVGPQAPGVAYHAVSDQRSSPAIKAFLAEVFGLELMTGRAEELNL